MRDYFVHPAQTNLELYGQAIECGYTAPQRRRLADAYHFALRQVFPLARGSGKPFIAHLVGTASLVLESGCRDEWVIGALLHAVYQRRIPFCAGLLPDERRPLVAQQFGPAVDDLVNRYTAFEDMDLRTCPPGLVATDGDVLTLRLADELEDICGYALALHGDSDDSAERGGSRWRRDAKTAEAPALLQLAQDLGLDGIGRGLSHWLDFASDPEGLQDMRTGWLSSISLAEQDQPG